MPKSATLIRHCIYDDMYLGAKWGKICDKSHKNCEVNYMVVCVLPVSLSSLKSFSAGRQLVNQQQSRLILHNSRASIDPDSGIIQRNVAAGF